MRKVIYVNCNAKKKGDGSSWDTAFKSLQDGLFYAKMGLNTQIWVAKGIYYPSEQDRKKSFVLKSRVDLYGGFKGGETALKERDWEKNITILSGNIGENKQDIFINSFHVVTGADNAILDGFTIEDGTAIDEPVDLSYDNPPPPPAVELQGATGGIGGRNGNDFDQNLIIMYPEAIPGAPLRQFYKCEVYSGAGLYLVQGSPIIRNCIVRNCIGHKGGGVYILSTRELPPKQERVQVYFENVIFENNRAFARGGGVSVDMFSSPTFKDCIFRDNYCDAKGGALYNDFCCDPLLINCLFETNYSLRASAMGNDGNSNPLLYNCTFTENKAGDIGPCMYQGTYGANMAGEMGLDPKDETILYANVPYLNKCLIVNNRAVNSFSPNSNWHDSDLDIKDCFIEQENGEYTGIVFEDAVNKNFDVIASSKLAEYGYKKGLEIENLDELLKKHEEIKAFAYPYDVLSKGSDNSIIYVKQGGKGDGYSWDQAAGDLKSVLDIAKDGQQIWVTKGKYLPTKTDDRQASFVLKQGVKLYGGFLGTEAILEERDIQANETILSGDIGKGDKEKNAYHVVVSTSDALIDGFTIRDGCANGRIFNMRGAGLIGRFGDSPTIRNCTFINNTAIEGAGLSFYKKAKPVIENCRFINNNASRGGAMMLRDSVDAHVVGCIIKDNAATDRGGAVYTDYGACPVFENSVFENNTSVGNGGGVYIDDNASQVGDTSPSFKNVKFIDNKTRIKGGAISVINFACFVTIDGCIFESNEAVQGGGAVSIDFQVELTMKDCTFAGNKSQNGEKDVQADETCLVKSM